MSLTSGFYENLELNVQVSPLPKCTLGVLVNVNLSLGRAPTMRYLKEKTNGTLNLSHFATIITVTREGVVVVVVASDQKMGHF